MITNLFAPLALLPLHGGHGQNGDSHDLLLRIGHYLTDPQHVVPAVLCAALVATILVLRRRRDDPFR